MHTRLSRLLAPLLALLATRPGGALAQGCAMCGSSFAENDPTTRAFSASVLFLLVAPYAIFCAAAGCIVVLYRRGMLGRRAPVIPLSSRHVPVPDGPKEVSP